MRFPVVLFDLDGTLVDSGAMILKSFRHATREVLGVEVPDEVLMAGVGGSSLREQLHALHDHVDELLTVYREHNRPLHSELRFFPRLDEVLTTLHEEGRKLGLVTAKRQESIDLALEMLPELRLLDPIVGSDELERGKPHPDGILLALERLGATPAGAVYVGDSPFDMAATKAAGVYAIAVTWGNIQPLELVRAEGPDAVVDTVDELLASL